MVIQQRGKLPSLNDVFSEPDLTAMRDAPWFRTLCGVTGSSSQTPDQDYALLKSSLIGGGFSLKKVMDFLSK